MAGFHISGGPDGVKTHTAMTREAYKALEDSGDAPTSDDSADAAKPDDGKQPGNGNEPQRLADVDRGSIGDKIVTTTYLTSQGVETWSGLTQAHPDRSSKDWKGQIKALRKAGFDQDTLGTALGLFPFLVDPEQIDLDEIEQDTVDWINSVAAEVVAIRHDGTDAFVQYFVRNDKLRFEQMEAAGERLLRHTIADPELDTVERLQEDMSFFFEHEPGLAVV